MRSSDAKVIVLHEHKVKKQRCIFCGSSEDLQVFKKQTICLKCQSSIRQLYDEGHFKILS